MYVRVRAHTCTRNCSDQTKEHTQILSGALLTAHPRAHRLTHTHTLQLLSHTHTHTHTLVSSWASSMSLLFSSSLPHTLPILSSSSWTRALRYSFSDRA